MPEQPSIYTKSEQVDIAADDIRQIVADYEKDKSKDGWVKAIETKAGEDAP